MNTYPLRYNRPNYNRPIYDQPWQNIHYGFVPPPIHEYRGPRPTFPTPPHLYPEISFSVGNSYGSHFLAPATAPPGLQHDFSVPPPSLPNPMTPTPYGGEPGNPTHKPGTTTASSTFTSQHTFSPDAPVFVPKVYQHPITPIGEFRNDQRNPAAGRCNGKLGAECLKRDETANDEDLPSVSSSVKPRKPHEASRGRSQSENYDHSSYNYHANKYSKFQQHDQQNHAQNHNDYRSHKFQSRDLYEIKSDDVSRTSGSQTPLRKNPKSVAQSLKKSNVQRAPWHDVTDDSSPSPPLEDDFGIRESSAISFNGQYENHEQENVRPHRGCDGEDSPRQNVKTRHSFNGPFRENPEYTNKFNVSHTSYKDGQRDARYRDEISTKEYYNSSIRSGYSRGHGRGYSHEEAFSRPWNDRQSYKSYRRGDLGFRGKSRGHSFSAEMRGNSYSSEMAEHDDRENPERLHGRGGFWNYLSRHEGRFVNHGEYDQHQSERGSYQNPRPRGSHAFRGYRNEYDRRNFNSHPNENGPHPNHRPERVHSGTRDNGEYGQPEFNSYLSERGSFRNNVHSAREGSLSTQHDHKSPGHNVQHEVKLAHRNEDDQRRRPASRPNHGAEGYKSRHNDWLVKRNQEQDGQRQAAATGHESSDDLEAQLSKKRMNSRQTMLLLDDYNSDLNLIVDANGYGASTLDNPYGFLKLWADIKATHGANKGKLYFEVNVIELVPVDDAETTDPCPHAVRVGWSTEQSTFEDGTGSWCLGYHEKTEFISGQGYCESFQVKDVIGAILDLESSPATVLYLKNGVIQGDPSTLADFSPADPATALFPHISLKNSKVRVNFGQRVDPWFPPPEGISFIGQVPMEDLVPSLTPPERKSDCEIVMLIGLPGSGKTTWALEHQRRFPKQRYNILGTDQLIELMNGKGSSCSEIFHQFKDVATSCFDRLLKIAAMKWRNYVIDQTNVFQSARLRKLSGFTAFRKMAIVIQPSDRELSRRSKERSLSNNKIVLEGELRNMKANYALPDDCKESFHEIEYVGLQENEARELVELYNFEGQKNKPLLTLD